ncbi:hypothetical protein PG994_008344 [Apiospora phragmitis]|uniref:Uncharacterized protein n=1 Tax=Apiospora phragmitis TaxID=2905665 RepID=A0ABR1USS2_9PEZI
MEEEAEDGFDGDHPDTGSGHPVFWRNRSPAEQDTMCCGVAFVQGTFHPAKQYEASLVMRLSVKTCYLSRYLVQTSPI